MARILITGSSDGLGLSTAQALVKRGHKITLHARNAQRAKDAEQACPGAEGVLIGDLTSIAETKKLAADANNLGAFDTVIHNAGLAWGSPRRTQDGVPALFAVNTLAPYMLTCLMNRPRNLVYVSSNMHMQGDDSLKDIFWKQRGDGAWQDSSAYCDSKLHAIMLANAFARKFADEGVVSNSLDPGWVPTKMGGPSASGSLQDGIATYVKLATRDGVSEKDTGMHWANSKVAEAKPASGNVEKQEELLRICEEATGVKLPV